MDVFGCTAVDRDEVVGVDVIDPLQDPFLEVQVDDVGMDVVDVIKTNYVP